MAAKAFAVLFLLMLCSSFSAFAKQPADTRVEELTLSRVTREVDLTSPLVKQKVTMALENDGPKPVSVVLFTVEPQLAGKVAYIGAQVSCGSGCIFVAW